MATTKKRGQVTLFIILGLIILVGIVLLIYFKASAFKKWPLKLITEDAPNELKPLQTFVTECLEQVSREAIVKIGLGGGYLEPTNSEYTPYYFQVNQNNPTESDILVINQNNKVPYWYYMNTPNSCYNCMVTEKNIPTFEDMQRQISVYVEKNIDSCLNDFKAFEDMKIKVIKLEKPTSEAYVGSDDVTVQIYYPLEIKAEKLSGKLEYFNVKHPLSIPAFYELALIVTKAEKSNRFMEKIVLFLVDVYSGPDTNKLPPLSTSQIGYSTLFWVKQDVQDKIQELLRSYIPLISIENTKNAKKITTGDKLKDYVYNYMFLENKIDFNKYDVRFYYMDWPIYLDIGPHSTGGLIKPSVTNVEIPGGILPTETVADYSFVYNIGFPILVEISDPEALNGKGYSFFFAIESNIKANKDIIDYLLHGAIVDYDPKGFFEITSKKKEEEKLSTVEEGVKQLEINLPEKNFFCEDEQKVGTELTLVVTDKQTKEPLQKIGVFYQCGPLATCRMGETDEKGKFVSKYPLCKGGAIKLMHNDYSQTIWLFDSTIEEKIKAQVIDMIKQVKKKYKIKIIDVNNLKSVPNDKLKDKQFIKQFRDKYAYEEVGTESMVTLLLTRVKENAYLDDFLNMAKFDLISTKMEGEFNFIPAEAPDSGYEFNIMYINNTKHHMDGSPNIVCKIENNEKVCWDTCPSTLGQFPPQDIDKTVQGSVSVEKNEDNYLWNVDYNMLSNSDKEMLIFYLLKIKLPSCTKNIGDLGKLQEYSKTYRWFIQPEFVSSKDEGVIT